MSSSQAARLAQVLELVESLEKPLRDTSKARFERIRQNAIAAVRQTTHSRTNQFAVRDQLAGLQEKAEIVGRMDLANALADAVGKANALENKWMPECLSLLLQISDRPLDKTDISKVEAIHSSVTEDPLTWEDILRDKPHDSDDGLWDNIDYRGDNSEEDDEISLIRSESSSPSLHSLAEDSQDPLLELESATCASILEPVEEWRAKVGSFKQSVSEQRLLITESHLLQEILQMLQDHPTDLFEFTDRHWHATSNLRVEDLSDEVLHSTLSQCASLGTQLVRLRSWSAKRTQEPIEQSLQSTLRRAVCVFDIKLCDIERGIMTATEGPSTLLGFMPQIRNAFQSIAVFARIHHHVAGKLLSPFGYLDLLHEETSHQQILGSHFAFIGARATFEQCFHTFLKPVRAWLCDGSLPENGLTFLKKNDDQALKPTTFWSDHFIVVQDEGGMPAAPEFFKPFVAEVISIGKTIVFLQMLGEPIPSRNGGSGLPAISVDILGGSELTSFEHRLDEVLHEWISSRQSHLEHGIGHALRSTCGLSHVFNAIEHVFLGRNGACFDQVAMRLLEGGIAQKGTLKNSRVLTAIYQDAWSACTYVTPSLINVQVVSKQNQGLSDSDVMLSVSGLEVFYALPWPVANIVTPECLTSYRRLHVLLLQLRIAKHAIDRSFGLNSADTGLRRSRSQALSLSLQYRMRWFLNTISSYFLVTVLSITHHQLSQVAVYKGGLDKLIRLHSETVETTLKRCLLGEGNAQAQKALSSLLRLALVVASSVRGATEAATEAETLPGNGINESKLENLSSTFTKLLGFVHAGVLEASRTEGDRCLQILAQDLSGNTSA